jgi:hypothetical protein
MHSLYKKVFFHSNNKTYVWSTHYGTCGWHRTPSTVNLEYLKQFVSPVFLTFGLELASYPGNMIQFQQMVNEFQAIMLINYLVDRNQTHYYSSSDDLLIFLKLQNHTIAT